MGRLTIPDIPALALQATLALPPPLLRALSGGGAVHAGGRTLDARFQFLSARAQTSPPLFSLTPQEARERGAKADARFSGRARAGVTVERLRVPTPSGMLAARVYRPELAAPEAALLVYAHGGGGVVGDLDTEDSFCALFAQVAGWPLVSIDYRRAPEHRFPSALDDLLAACRWGRLAAEDHGAKAGRIAVGGQSMGGNLAASVCQLFRQGGEPQPVLQLLICPLLDAAGEEPSMTTYAGAWPLGTAEIRWFLSHYMGAGDSPDDPRLSPLREPDLAGLAPALIACAGFDPLLDQSEAYARKLAAAQTACVYRCYDALPHGFTAFIDLVPAAEAASRDIAAIARDFLAVEAP